MAKFWLKGDGKPKFQKNRIACMGAKPVLNLRLFFILLRIGLYMQFK